MSITSLLVVAVALAMDALAVAVATGLRLQCVTLEQTGRMAGLFGLFQALMPITGWLLGTRIQRFVEGYDHWVAFGLLAFVGARMLKEAWEMHRQGDDYECPDPTQGSTLLMLALATSIDALAVGFSMAVLGVSIWFPALVIGFVCFALTALGMHIGRLVRCSGKLGSASNAFGGLVLVLIGANILREHGV
ncbi:manganese efflux pump MntP family protein, partial [Desulfovibrio sp. OttesenSCG-928-I05]|nr:manganese efflux pump MntP family protein [Desulfovibrio sp. OttesenSCG-928-I05]